MWSSTLQNQALTGSLQNSCKKLFGRLTGRALSVLQKDSTMDVSSGSFQRFSEFFSRTPVDVFRQLNIKSSRNE